MNDTDTDTGRTAAHTPGDPRRIERLLAEIADPRSCWEDAEGEPLHRAARAYLDRQAALRDALEAALPLVEAWESTDGEAPVALIEQIRLALASARPEGETP